MTKNPARFSHENSKRVWNLDLLKTARLEIARVRGRGSEISLAPWLSHSRILEPRVFKIQYISDTSEVPRVFIFK